MFPFQKIGLLIAALFAVSVLPLRAAVPLDRIVVVVNDGVILQTEIDRAIDEALQQIRARGMATPPEDALRAQVLERLILQRLQTQRAQQAGIRIDDKELNEVLTRIAQQNGMTLAQFAEALRADGTDYLAVREQIREEILVNRLRQREVDSRVTVTDQDIELFLANQPANPDAEYRLAHILVSVPDGATPEQRAAARAKIDGLRARIGAGEDFASIAVAESDGQQALQGGDLDFRAADALPSLFASTAAKLSVGELSPVLETGNGFHLVQLMDTRGAGERQTVEETHARHLLVETNTLRNEAQAEALIRDLHDRVVAGESIEALAAEFSDDPGSKNNGGDLGWQPPGVFDPSFQAEVDALGPGELSAPFQTPFGWHIVRVEERRTRDVTELARRGRARQALQERRAAEEYDTWLRRLRAEAYIEYRQRGDGGDNAS